MSGGRLIQAESLTLAYGDRVALAHSTFQIPAAGITALIGPNGSGKSTLLHAIAGLIEPVSGTLVVPYEARKDIAYVLQATKLSEMTPITVWEAVAMGRYARLGFSRRFGAADRATCERSMARIGIGDLARRHLSELSAGQRQRVFVAQGLAQEASLLLLDEPITGLDLVSRDHILQVVQEEKSAGVTIVGTTHSLEEARMADHVLLLSGRVIASGSPHDVLTTDALGAAYGQSTIKDGWVLHDDPHHRPADTGHPGR